MYVYLWGSITVKNERSSTNNSRGAAHTHPNLHQQVMAKTRQNISKATSELHGSIDQTD